MLTELEKAQLMFKLARKNNWGNKYDRTEHFKRFQHLDDILGNLSKRGWIIVHPKGRFTGISLNTSFKKEIIEFIITQMPNVKDMV